MMIDEQSISNICNSTIEKFNDLTKIDKEKVINNLIMTLQKYNIETNQRIKFYDNQIQKKKEKIKNKQILLGIESNKYETMFTNKFNQLKFLKLEELKLDYFIFRKINRIKYTKKEIKELKLALGYFEFEEITEINKETNRIENINELTETLMNLRNEEKERESLRFVKIREILKTRKLLEDVFQSDFKNFKKQFEDIKSFEEIKVKIQKIETFLKNTNLKTSPIYLIEDILKNLNSIKLEKEKIKKKFIKEINIYAQILKKDCIISDNLFEIKSLLNNLIKENELNFKKVFQEALIEYKELLDLFNEEECIEINEECFTFTNENFKVLQEIKERINILNPRKTLYIKIINTISNREELLNKIIEFEKKSCDPKRLKGSSLILFKEEAFRKKIIPKLFIIEEELLNLIVSYEESFGLFIFKGIKYKMRLKKEISERILKK